jgi:hypothetical protein
MPEGKRAGELNFGYQMGACIEPVSDSSKAGGDRFTKAATKSSAAADAFRLVDVNFAKITVILKPL